MKATDKDVFTSILVLTELKGYPPTVRELAAAVGLKSVGSMKVRLNSLKSRGLVAFDPHSPRTLKMTERGCEECLRTR